MGFELDVRDALGLTKSVLAYLGHGARLSIEDFPREYEADIAAIPGAIDREDPPLFRGTIWPRSNFWIVPVVPETEAEVLALIESPDLIAALAEVFPERAAMHLQVEKDGEIQLGAHDYFDVGSTRTGPGIPEELLQSLVEKGVLHGYESAQVVTEEPDRYRGGWFRRLFG